MRLFASGRPIESRPARLAACEVSKRANNTFLYCVRLDAFIYCDEDTSYDADEADMQFLRSSSNFLTVDEFEKIIEKLELESRDQVVSLHEFHRDHPELLIEPLTKVYDYWIERKMVGRFRL